MITTPRLHIRRFMPQDWMDLYEYLGDASVVQFEPYAPFTRDQCRHEAKQRADDPAFWAVCLPDSGKVIGNIYLKYISPSDLFAWELGFVFNKNYQKKGYAYESCIALIDYAFTHWGAHRITALCNPQNTASWRLLERLGMRREGHQRNNVYFSSDEQGHPLWQDTYEYAILAEEWQLPTAQP